MYLHNKTHSIKLTPITMSTVRNTKFSLSNHDLHKNHQAKDLSSESNA